MDGSSLKSAQLLDQMRLHMATDAGKELTKKVGLVYQLNIAPKKLGVDEEIFVVDLKKGEGRTRGSRMLPSPSLTKISLESPLARPTRRLLSSKGRLKSRGALARRRSSPLTSSPSQRSCRRLECIIWVRMDNKVSKLQPLCT
ncbi:uncharacterized protein LOC120704640 isoform X1 [Panicum virgatum]|uniref:uncharacterized protein LOC120704640 isoform X1 n=1 Tax=Panicum virgatum TaxID=38727 RepID=UPI0019D59846|nr:uncharacterized protein LOC120704640 isoform X1 [Panicum virgatum]